MSPSHLSFQLHCLVYHGLMSCSSLYCYFGRLKDSIVVQRRLLLEWPLKAHLPLESIPRQNTFFRYMLNSTDIATLHALEFFDADDTGK